MAAFPYTAATPLQVRCLTLLSSATKMDGQRLGYSMYLWLKQLTPYPVAKSGYLANLKRVTSQ